MTIQGEGRSVGRLAYFIRLAGCNLWCRWCDSLHSVDPEKFRGKTAPIDYSKVPSNCSLVVITGGEPTLFDLAEIRRQLLKGNPNIAIEVETNATVFPTEIVDDFLWNLSPKLKSSEQIKESFDQKRMLKLGEWARYAQGSRGNVIFKFVIVEKGDLEEVQKIVDEFAIPPSLVYLMAQGATTESQSLSAVGYLVNSAKERGFNFSPRLHVMFWGEKRGV